MLLSLIFVLLNVLLPFFCDMIHASSLDLCVARMDYCPCFPVLGDLWDGAGEQWTQEFPVCGRPLQLPVCHDLEPGAGLGDFCL